MSFSQHEHSGMLYYTADGLSAVGGVRHGFSTRTGGVSGAPWDSLNFDLSCGDDRENVRENYRRFCAALGVDERDTVLSQQRHTTNVRRVTRADRGMGLLRTRDFSGVDALITDEAGVALTVFSADCGTVLLYDPVRRAVGALHAGWRGCAGGIVARTVEAMRDAYGCRSEDLYAALGPCIGQCCFETDGDVPDAMRASLGAAADAYIAPSGAKYYVDLQGLNRLWLLRAGLAPGRIDTIPLCTRCHPELFWSHRRVGRARGSMIAMIALEEAGE